MQTYAIRRILLIIPTLILVTLLVFFAARFIPGDVVQMMVAEMGTEGAVANIELTTEIIRHKLGMDIPVHIQYGRWVGFLPTPDKGYNGLLQGNLGKSLWTDRSISQEIGSRIEIDIELAVIAVITSIMMSIPIGVYSAIRQDTPGDYIGRTISILFLSVPPFWIGTMVMVYPSIWWNWMPPIEYTPFFQDPAVNLLQFVIPGFILGMSSAGIEMRMTRTMMLEVLRQDYIRTAWSKGLTERTVVIRHALKNALIPVITMVGLRIAFLISGEVVMETIFSLPGVGRYLFEALNKRDYPIISGVNVVMATLILFVNMIVDLAYGWMDPRVQYK